MCLGQEASVAIKCVYLQCTLNTYAVVIAIGVIPQLESLPIIQPERE